LVQKDINYNTVESQKEKGSSSCYPSEPIWAPTTHAFWKPSSDCGHLVLFLFFGEICYHMIVDSKIAAQMHLIICDILFVWNDLRKRKVRIRSIRDRVDAWI
jgi:hypothetical protein